MTMRITTQCHSSPSVTWTRCESPCSSLLLSGSLCQTVAVDVRLYDTMTLCDSLWSPVIPCDHVSINDGCQSQSFSDRTPSTMILTSWQVMFYGGLPVAVLSNVTWCGCVSVSVSVSVSLRMRVREESQWISGESPIGSEWSLMMIIASHGVTGWLTDWVVMSGWVSECLLTLHIWILIKTLYIWILIKTLHIWILVKTLYIWILVWLFIFGFRV